MQKKAHVSVSAKKKHTPPKKGKLRHMIIKGAENGYLSEMHYMPPEPKEGEPMNYMDQEPTTNVHPTMDHLVDHIRGQASAFGGTESPEEEAEEAKEQAGGRTPDASSN